MASDPGKLPDQPGARAEVDAFLRKLAATPSVRPVGQRGRLIFALDATASRQPTWDQACQIQAEMFRETAALGLQRRRFMKEGEPPFAQKESEPREVES